MTDFSSAAERQFWQCAVGSNLADGFEVRGVFRHRGVTVEMWGQARPSSMWVIKAASLPELTASRLADLINEVSVIEAAVHQNIVKFHGWERTDHGFLIATEHADAGSLLERVGTSERYTENDVSSCILSVCAAMAHCCKLNLIHRGLNPKALRYVSSGNSCLLKVCDWECAVWTHGEPVAGAEFKGTPQFMAPEMVLGYDYSHTVDMWSTGMVLYLLLAGELPFDVTPAQQQHGDFRELYQRVRSEEVLLRDECFQDVSPEAQELLLSMLRRHLGQRLTFTQALKSTWLRNAHKEVSFDSLRSSQRKIEARREGMKMTGNFQSFWL
eukprot:TRINITY_DN44213_c0_g1_i2.p1 TRINITY_DN44213_c0_g1~~TRINITY_DN44213_c0_g1_i2.p1  ORF type:complete len:327 (-),score=72.72 TRINITY_DN44213_c0_g1_i2:127-1107(-)